VPRDYRRLTAEEKDIIRSDHELGIETKRIARRLNRSSATIRAFLNRESKPSIHTLQSESSTDHKTDLDPLQHPSDISHPSPPPDDRTERGGRGRAVLWTILHDGSAPPVSRIRAFEALDESERWSRDHDERRLPPPLSRAELIQRQVSLLLSLDDQILSEVLAQVRLSQAPAGKS